jgi:hypothetical protein
MLIVVPEERLFGEVFIRNCSCAYKLYTMGYLYEKIVHYERLFVWKAERLCGAIRVEAARLYWYVWVEAGRLYGVVVLCTAPETVELWP